MIFSLRNVLADQSSKNSRGGGGVGAVGLGRKREEEVELNRMVSGEKAHAKMYLWISRYRVYISCFKT